MNKGTDAHSLSAPLFSHLQKAGVLMMQLRCVKYHNFMSWLFVVVKMYFFKDVIYKMMI